MILLVNLHPTSQIYHLKLSCCFGCKQKCHVKNKDIRKFLDGIYVSDKGAIAEE
jgi:hypothetical protein